MRINLSRTELCSGAGACHGWRFEPPGSPRHPCFVSDLSALSPPPWKKARDRLQSLLNSSFNFHLRYPPLGSHRMPPLRCGSVAPDTRRVVFRNFRISENNKNDRHLRACGRRFVRGTLCHTLLIVSGGLASPRS